MHAAEWLAGGFFIGTASVVAQEELIRSQRNGFTDIGGIAAVGECFGDGGGGLFFATGEDDVRQFLDLLIVHRFHSAGARQAVGVVIVWGVSLATLLTLFVIPVFYAAFARGTRSPETIARELEAGLAETDARPVPAE